MSGFRFKVGEQEVEFAMRKVRGVEEFYAVLKLASAVEAVRLASSLRAVEVDADVVGNMVRLDSDAFFGLLAAVNATPPGLTPIYRSEDLHMYASVEGRRVRYYIVVKHEGV